MRDDKGDNDNAYFNSKVKEADRLHDRGIDLCYVYEDYDQALVVLHTACHMRESLLGKFHPDTALSYFRIASILFEYKNSYHDALRMSRRELRISHRLLGQKSQKSNRDTTLDTQKSMIRREPWLAERIAWFNTVLENVSDLSKEEKANYCEQMLHSIAMEQFGDSCMAMNDWEGAITNYNNVLALECTAYAGNLLDTADLQIKVSECLVQLHDPDAAIEELRHAVRKYHQVWISDFTVNRNVNGTAQDRYLLSHSSIAEVYNKIGAILLLQERFDDALGEFAKAYSMFEDSLGKMHPRSLEALIDMKAVTVREMEHIRQEERLRMKKSKKKK